MAIVTLSPAEFAKRAKYPPVVTEDSLTYSAVPEKLPEVALISRPVAVPPLI